MGFLKEFKEFAMKGNVIDLAVGVIIGGAFGAIIKSMIDDVITPLLLNPALVASGAKDISQLTYGAVRYGSFLSAVISFIMIAFVLFAIIKLMNSVKKKEVAAPEAPASPSNQELLLGEIRDLLKEKA